MSKIIEYRSVLAPFIKEFIELKESANIDTRTNKSILLEIDRFFVDSEISEPIITKDIIEQWHKTRVNDSQNTLKNKFSVWSQLARFMSRHGFECYVHKLPLYRRSTRPGYHPYIYTHEQIDSILNGSSELCVKRHQMSEAMFCIPVILRLLYSTGLRVSEALSVINSDVKMDKGYIHIRKTKNGCERIVPINTELQAVLQQYIYYRDKLPVTAISAADNAFFVRPDGEPCTYQAIYRWFRELLRASGIPYSGKCRGPRIHDLRHTMAVHSLEKMVSDGMDLYAAMPIISTCLGHKSLSSTEQYVRLTYEMFPKLVEQCAEIAFFVYPKI